MKLTKYTSRSWIVILLSVLLFFSINQLMYPSWMQMEDNDFRAFQSVYVGIILFVFAFTLLQYFQNRNTSYFLYAIYLLVNLIYFIKIFPDLISFLVSDDVLQVLYHFKREYSNLMEVAFSMLFIAAYARFTQSFLNLKEQYPHINNWVNFGYKIMLMYVIIDFLIILTIGKSVFFELFAKFSLVIPGVYAFYQMYKAKKLIFDFIWLGSLMIILGAALTVIIIQLKINGFYDSSLDLSGRKFFFYMLSGSLLEILFFTSAIGYQGLLNEKEKNETQQKLFDQLNENNSLRIRQLESDVKTLKSQINPHFIFNSLNAIKLLIQENKNPKANQYLIQFSELLRIVMEQATLPKITLEEELETSQVYLELESLRFDKSFQFEIIQDEGIDLSFIDVPPLIFQPFLENAIWHGLLHKQGERKLSINILKNGDFVFCEIEDNGIGRAKSKALAYQYGKLKKSSIGIKNTKERISIFQKLYKTNLELEIIDLIDQRDIPQGTKIVFKILI